MKAFAVGLLFIIAVSVLAGIGIMFFPLLIVFGFFFKIALAVLYVIFCIWLLGKFIILLWEDFFKSKWTKVEKIH